MNQEQFDKLKLLKEEKDIDHQLHEQAVKQHKARQKHLNEELHKIHKECDHKYPNGKSAWVGTFMYSYCEICGLNDL